MMKEEARHHGIESTVFELQGFGGHGFEKTVDRGTFFSRDRDHPRGGVNAHRPAARRRIQTVRDHPREHIGIGARKTPTPSNSSVYKTRMGRIVDTFWHTRDSRGPSNYPNTLKKNTMHKQYRDGMRFAQNG
jgi:hypothetical protein